MEDFQSRYYGEEVEALLEKAGTALQPIPGKGLSSNDYTNEDKTALATYKETVEQLKQGMGEEAAQSIVDSIFGTASTEEDIDAITALLSPNDMKVILIAIKKYLDSKIESVTNTISEQVTLNEEQQKQIDEQKAVNEAQQKELERNAAFDDAQQEQINLTDWDEI